jgi:hypothetical protein
MKPHMVGTTGGLLRRSEKVIRTIFPPVPPSDSGGRSSRALGPASCTFGPAKRAAPGLGRASSAPLESLRPSEERVLGSGEQFLRGITLGSDRSLGRPAARVSGCCGVHAGRAELLATATDETL